MKSYKIGILHSETGTMSNSERPLIGATELAIQEINASGGVLEHKIERLIVDGASQAQLFADQTKQLHKEGIENIFGCWTSSSRKAVKSIVEKNNMLLWYPVQYEGLEESRNIVYTGSCLNQQIEPALIWLSNNGYKNLFLIGSDYIYPKTANRFIHSLSKKLDINILGEHYKLLGSSDFANCLQEIKSSGPCAIFNTLNGDSNIHFFQQYQEQKLNPDKYPILSVSIAENELEYIGNAANHHYLCWSYFHTLKTEINKNFVRKFKQQYPEFITTSDPVEAAYSQVYLWKNCVEKAGSFQIDSIIEALPGSRYSAPGGEYEILPNHHIKKKAIIANISATGDMNMIWESPLIEPLPWLGVEKSNVENLDVVTHILGEFSAEIQKSDTQSTLARALKNSENRFKALSDASFEGVAISENGNIIDCNRALLEMFGYTKEKIIGLGPMELVHPDSIESVMEKVLSNQNDSYRAIGLKKDGSTFPMEIQGKPIEYMGKAARVTTVFDLTENEKAKEQLRESEIKLQNILNYSDSLILMKDLDGKYQFVNKKFSSLFGKKHFDFIGKTDYDIFPETTADILRKNDLKVLKSNTSYQFDEEIPYGNNIYTYISTKFPLLDIHGNSISICCVSTDITDRKKTELAIIHEKEKAQNYLDTAGVILVAIDLNGIVNMINKKGCDVLGYDESEIVGKNWFENFLPEHIKQEVQKVSHEILSGKKSSTTNFENPVLTKSGEERLIAWYNQELFDENGISIGHLSSGEDITEKKAMEQKLHLASKIIESTSDAIVITDTEANIIDINPAYSNITGFQKEDVLGKNPRFSKSGRHNKDFYKKMWESIIKKGSWSGEIWDRHSNGEVYPKLLSINTLYDEQNKPQAYIGFFSDISMLKHTEEQLHQVAYFDPLTGLPNRSLFLDRLKHEVSTSKRLSTEFALMFIDLDKFKNVNDTLGHNIGDELLAIAGKRISSRLRENDTVSRLGGDEFTVILSDIDSDQHVANVAASLIELLQEPFQLSGSEVFIGASIGIAMYPKDSEEVETLTKFADLAMYQAKNAGRKTFRFFTEKMNREVQRHLEIEKNLRKAILNDELELFYQPRTLLSNDKIVGCEALLRWRTLDGKFILPDEFIPIAEGTGLIIPVGDWVIKKAIEQSEKWQKTDLKNLLVSINLSAKQLNDKSFVQKVMNMIKDSPVQPRNFSFEITESTLMADPERAIKILKELKTIGFEISIDDFGTGYSSLSYLTQFPIDTLKIDQSFVRDILEDKDDAAIVVTIISMACSLGLDVVAEGIELETQKDFLKEHNCRYGQGYLFSKPLSVKEFELFVARPNKTDSIFNTENGDTKG